MKIKKSKILIFILTLILGNIASITTPPGKIHRMIRKAWEDQPVN
jgi:hypothetical protein